MPEQRAEQRADTESSDTESSDTESSDTESSDTESTDTESTDTESSDIDSTVHALRARADELDDQRRRALADLDNLRKRVARDADRQRSEERARVAAHWLPVVDHLDLALEHVGTDPEAIVKGVEAVRDQAIAVLAQLGFARREEVGATFDPARHEAVAVVSDPNAPAGTVVHVVRPGYGDEENQLRPAAVVVARGE